MIMASNHRPAGHFVAVLHLFVIFFSGGEFKK